MLNLLQTQILIRCKNNVLQGLVENLPVPILVPGALSHDSFESLFDAGISGVVFTPLFDQLQDVVVSLRNSRASVEK